jgi:hypothetical protein
MSADPETIPAVFFQITSTGLLIRHTNKDGRLISEFRYPELGPDSDDEPCMIFDSSTRYNVLNAPDFVSGVHVTREREGEVGFLLISFESWCEEGYWTTDERLAGQILATWHRGRAQGASEVKTAVRQNLKTLDALVRE